jgi:hypothetical protein
MLAKFWSWYERHYRLHVTIAAGLFALQLLHLYWLTTHIVALRLVGTSYFNVTGIWQFLLVIVDYTEIPTLISVSLLYINELRKEWRWKSVLYLFFLNSQWLHLFWITDEVVAELLIGSAVIGLPVWLAWVAIGIDYLELPVIYDTIRRLIASWRTPKQLASVFTEQD